jgi:hypothetical protein
MLNHEMSSREAVHAQPFTAEEQIENFSKLVHGVSRNADPKADIQPHIFLWYGRQVLVFPMDSNFACPQTRHDLAGAIRVVASQTKPSGFGLIMPAWAAYNPNFHEKKECVLLHAETCDGMQKTSVLPVERHEDAPPTYGTPFSPPEDAEGRGDFIGVFDDELPDPTLDMIFYVMQFLQHVAQIVLPHGWDGFDPDIAASFGGKVEAPENRTVH